MKIVSKSVPINLPNFINFRVLAMDIVWKILNGKLQYYNSPEVMCQNIHYQQKKGHHLLKIIGHLSCYSDVFMKAASKLHSNLEFYSVWYGLWSGFKHGLNTFI